MRKNDSKLKAFTLIELIISILVIAVLAALAIPGYFENAEKARGSKALQNLSIISSAQIIYGPLFSTYSNDVVSLQTYGGFEVDDGDWLYSVSSGVDSFTATATRNIPQRPDYDGKTITIDEQSVITVDGIVNGDWPP